MARTSRREHSSEIIGAILSLHKLNKSHDQIAEHLKILKFSVSTILYCQARNLEQPLCLSTRKRQLLKLDGRARRNLIYHVEQYPQDNFASMATSSKTEHTFCWTTIQNCLKAAGYFRFKAQKKLYLSSKHKLARLKWAKEHVNWTLEHIIWTNEATFETSWDTHSCYMTQRQGTAMESRYLKPTFKSGKTITGIWKAITLGFSSLFAEKKM